MISTPAEVVYFFKAALRLARFDATAREAFPNTRRMAARSFFVAVLILPFIFYDLHREATTTYAHLSVWRVAVVGLSAHVITITAFPLAMVGLSRLLERQDNYFRYVTAFNWSTLVMTLIIAPILLLNVNGMLEGQAMAFASLVSIYLLAFNWFVAKTMLDISGLAAVGVLAANAVLEFMVLVTVGGLYGPPGT